MYLVFIHNHFAISHIIFTFFFYVHYGIWLVDVEVVSKFNRLKWRLSSFWMLVILTKLFDKEHTSASGCSLAVYYSNCCIYLLLFLSADKHFQKLTAYSVLRTSRVYVFFHIHNSKFSTNPTESLVVNVSRFYRDRTKRRDRNIPDVWGDFW